MAKQSARPPTDDEIADINAKRASGLKRLGVDGDASPAEVAQAADEYVDAQQVERSKYFKGFYLLVFHGPQNIIDEVGAAWGEQLVRAFGWQWQYVVRKSEFERAVASPDSAVVVFPGNYLDRMLTPPYDDVTLMLMFNMIQAKELPEESAGALVDISDGRLRHIIPKR
jgi:hypothetical protein